MNGTEDRQTREIPFREPVSWEDPEALDWAPLLEREWIVTNGLGGYASGTLAGALTRRYHGLLVAAHGPPLGRVLTLADLVEVVDYSGENPVRLGGEERGEALEMHGAEHLVGFRLEWSLPVWTYSCCGRILEKRVLLEYGRNTTLLSYRLLEGDGVGLELRPMIRFRQYGIPVDRPLEADYDAWEEGEFIRVRGAEGFPELRLRFPEHGRFTTEPRVISAFMYRVEASRGYASVGDTWSPGSWRGRLERDGSALMVASTEQPADIPDLEMAASLAAIERTRRAGLIAQANPALRSSPGAELVLAADQFVVRPLRLHRTINPDDRSIIAGYHWFTDWGRDTMISLEGLTLATGRPREAGLILRTFGNHVRDGLIPNLFPEGENEGLYNTADATLWYFHALDRYLRATHDWEVLRDLLTTLRQIVEAHVRGTRFGIGVDPEDGLLRQGEEGKQLTWMDAKVGDWVVTPRRGKAVEINALWYNALRVMARWEEHECETGRAAALDRRADRVRESFNRRFWIEEAGYLYDVVDGEDGDDASFRPNQIFAVSLPNPVLDSTHWEPVVLAVHERLLTSAGLRSLDPADPDYRPTYFGDILSRDAAYHQGTVWPWLLGAFVDAWLRIRPDDTVTARAFLDGGIRDLDAFGLGTVAEIFDGDPPHRPRGCIAQAWSVAELIRSLVRLANA